MLLGGCAAFAAGRVVVNDVNGAKIVPLEGKKRKATVLFFITNDCPIANSYAPEIERIFKEYSPKQILFYLVYVDPAQTPEADRKHRREYGYTFPGLLDPTHKLVKLSHAGVTPEAAIFMPDGKLVYHGRIDDRAVDFGTVRAMPLKRDLREALDALLSGKMISNPNPKAVGCYISDLTPKK